ncbi:MAG: PHB depolymerase family esterase [Lysobacteraceae bacterium]
MYPRSRALVFAVGTVVTVQMISGCGSSAAESAALPALQIDAQRVAVAGLSSGAYMATQAHLVFSDRIQAAGLVAGGPYGCAKGDLNTALSVCMRATPSAPDAAELAAQVRQRAADGKIAPLAGLQGDQVFVFHGSADSTVVPQVGAATEALYALLQSDASMHLTTEFTHALPHVLSTAGEGGECSEAKAPFVAACGVDTAGLFFAHWLGDGVKPAVAATGSLRRFQQAELLDGEVDPLLADEGYVFVPSQCEQGRCGLLVAFHGCDQNVDKVGEAFVSGAGFNEWAQANDVVVLYPQTRASFAPLNPKACWDWWGYSGADYDTRDGVQMQWLDAALRRLGV